MFIRDTADLNYYDVDVVVHVQKYKRANGNYNLFGHLKSDISFLIAEDIPAEEADQLIKQIGLAKDNRCEVEGYVLNP